MKRQLFILLIATLLAPAGLMAQKMYKTGTGGTAQIILDMTNTGEGIGMPATAVTSTPKYDAAYMATPGNTPVNSASTMANNLESGSINATVYEKLEIAPQDLGTSGLGAGTMTRNWATAFTACQGLNHNGTGWRLPTQRELIMMWIFSTKINNMVGSTFTATIYWCATENASSSAWHVNFGNGITDNNTKSFTYRLRCVREL